MSDFFIDIRYQYLTIYDRMKQEIQNEELNFNWLSDEYGKIVVPVLVSLKEAAYSVEAQKVKLYIGGLVRL